MKELIGQAGRAFQLAALIALPSAIWVGEFGRSERGMAAIFGACLLVFFSGYVLILISKKL